MSWDRDDDYDDSRHYDDYDDYYGYDENDENDENHNTDEIDDTWQREPEPTNLLEQIRQRRYIQNRFYNNDFNDIVKFLNYDTNKEEQRYFADMSDSLIQNIFCLSFMFLKYHFV